MRRYSLPVLFVCAAFLAGCGSTEPAQSGDTRLNAQLGKAATEGNAERVRSLIEQGASPNIRDVMGLTPLIHAAMEGNAAVVEALLEGGAETETRDAFGTTALMYSVEGSGATTRALLESGAEVDAVDASGNTAIHQALMAEQYETAAILADAGADMQIENAEGVTPAELVRRAGMEVGNIQPDAASSVKLPPSFVDYEADCKLPLREDAEEGKGENAISYIDGERHGRGTPDSLDPQAVTGITVYKCAELIEEASLKGIVVIETENAE